MAELALVDGPALSWRVERTKPVLRYVSRLGSSECWAIFDGTTVEPVNEQRIEDQPQLSQVMEAFGLSR